MRAPLLLGALVALAILPGAAAAEGPAVTIDRPLVDTIGLLSPADAARVETAVRGLLADTGVHLAVVIIATLDGEPIEDYTHRIGIAWGGGDAKHDQGVLLVLAMTDRRFRLATGYGVEGALPDATARSLLDRVAPVMRRGEFAEAIVSIVTAVGHYTQGLDLPPVPEPPPPDLSRRHTLQALSAIAILLGALAAAALRRLRRRVPKRWTRWGIVWGAAVAGTAVAAMWAPDGYLLPAVIAQVPLLPVGWVLGRAPRGSIFGTVVLVCFLAVAIFVYGFIYGAGEPSHPVPWGASVVVLFGALILSGVMMFATYTILLIPVALAALAEVMIRRKEPHQSWIFGAMGWINRSFINALGGDPMTHKRLASAGGGSYSSSSTSSWSSSSSSSSYSLSSSSSSSSSGSSGGSWGGSGGSFGGGGASSSW